ncbi:MAG TPA: thiamine pyrophosphate-dependent enzyme, partial [Ramlibacter sp.]|nr:thiamine pyrophosphate-dependent enzyme [Ramlibacter sp.]
MSTIERRAFVRDLLAACPQALVVAGLGSPAWDTFAAGDLDTHFYLWGAMGGAAAMGLGLALAQPDRAVLVVTGDGEQLMGLGVLATVAAQQPRNLTLVVLDNGHYGETGMQRSHTSLGTDLTGVARSCGFAHVLDVQEQQGVAALAARVNAREGCSFARVRVAAEDLPK